MTELLNVRESARRLGVHENTIRNWANTGLLIPAWVSPRGHRRYDPAEIERMRLQLYPLDELWAE